MGSNVYSEYDLSDIGAYAHAILGVYIVAHLIVRLYSVR